MDVCLRVRLDHEEGRAVALLHYLKWGSREQPRNFGLDFGSPDCDLPSLCHVQNVMSSSKPRYVCDEASVVTCNVGVYLRAKTCVDVLLRREHGEATRRFVCIIFVVLIVALARILRFEVYACIGVGMEQRGSCMTRLKSNRNCESIAAGHDR